MEGGVDEIGRGGDDFGVTGLVEADADFARVQRETAADSLKERFLQCPELEEIGGLFVRIEGIEVAQFVRR